MSDIDTLKKGLTPIKRVITRFSDGADGVKHDIEKVVQLKGDDASEKKEIEKLLVQIETKIKKLSERLAEYTGIVEQICSKYPDPETEVFSTFYDKEIVYDMEVSTFISLCSKQLKDLEQKSTGTSGASTPVTVSTSASSTVAADTSSLVATFPPSYSRFPVIEVPKFNGDYSQWTTFWDTYAAHIHESKVLTDIHKFNLLHKYLEGNAKRCIEGIPETQKGYTEAIDILKKKFNVPHRIVASHYEAMRNLEHPVYNLTDLQVFHDKLIVYRRLLSSCGKKDADYGPVIIDTLLAKVPREVKVSLIRDCNSDDYSFQNLIDALEKEIRILEKVGNGSDKDKDCSVYRIGEDLGKMGIGNKKHGNGGRWNDNGTVSYTHLTLPTKA